MDNNTRNTFLILFLYGFGIIFGIYVLIDCENNEYMEGFYDGYWVAEK